MNIIDCGLYKLKDSYFEKFSSKFLIQNKSEKRPFYCAIRSADGIIWFIPLSTQVKSYKLIIEEDKEKYGNCLYYHIGRIAGRERVFLIGNMIPVKIEYIRSAFTIKGVPYIVKDKALIKAIMTKAKRYLSLVKAGKLRPNLDILKIQSKLQ